MKKYLVFFLIIMSLFISCSKKDRANLIDPISDGALSNWGPEWKIYDNSLNTYGGEIQFYTDHTKQKFDMSYLEDSSNKVILFGWDGSLVEELATGNMVTYAGFGLTFDNSLVTSRDLSIAAYDRIKFSLRGTIADDVILEVAGVNDDTDKKEFLGSDLLEDVGQEFYFYITVSLSSVSKIISFVFKYQGRSDMQPDQSLVYIDNIEFVKA